MENGFSAKNLIKEFESLDNDVQELIEAAIRGREAAYVPYSNFKVGAALKTDNGQIWTGCNIENGAYSSTICAERTAAVKAISEGHSKFVACAVVAQQETFTTPCGVCRQFLNEFAEKDFPVYVTKPDKSRVLCTTLDTLLPFSFVPIKNFD